jgi:TolB-like protein
MSMKNQKVLLLLIMIVVIMYGQQKDKIAILTLKNSSGVTTGEAEIISDRLRNDFFATGMVDVMERDQMQSILNEQGLQQSGVCTDDGCMVELGKMLGVRRLIAGSIGKLGSMYLLNVRSIDISTGKIDCAVTNDIKGEIEDVVSVLNTVASKLASLNCSKETAVPDKRVSVVTNAQEKEVIPEEPSVAKTVPCEGEIYLEKIKFDPAVLGFSLEESDIEDVEESFADAFEEALDRKIVVVSGSQLSTSRCATKVLKCSIKSYVTEGAARDQITGTLKIAISLFESPFAKTALTTVVVEKEGDRHWGQLKPLLNAVDEVVDVIEDDFYSEVRKYFK